MKTKTRFALAATSIDGRIALHHAHFTDWTSAEDKTHLRTLLDSSDLILVGNNTYKTAEEALRKRNCIVLSRQHPQALHRVHDRLAYYNPARGDIRNYCENCEGSSLCILGGTQTYSLALEKNMIDEIYLTIEPLLFGCGLPLFATSSSLLRNATLLTCTQLNTGGTLLLHYKIDTDTRNADT